MEKRLIFDPKVAQEIVTLIRDHSEGQKCPFIDADAGLCLIAREWQNICPNRPVIVFQRDQAFTPLADKLLNKNDHLPQISVKNHNLLLYEDKPDQGSSSNRNNINSYSSLTYEYRNSWENPAPGYSLFATATHGFCKGKIAYFFFKMPFLLMWYQKYELSQLETIVENLKEKNGMDTSVPTKRLQLNEVLLGSYYTYWSYKCFNPYFLDQPVRIFVNGGKFSNQYV